MRKYGYRFHHGLPPSNDSTMIFVVIDRLSKYAYFATLKADYSTTSVAEVFMKTDCKITRDFQKPISFGYICSLTSITLNMSIPNYSEHEQCISSQTKEQFTAMN